MVCRCSKWIAAYELWTLHQTDSCRGTLLVVCNLAGKSQIQNSLRIWLRLCWDCFVARFLLLLSLASLCPPERAPLETLCTLVFIPMFLPWRFQPEKVGARMGRKQLLKWDFAAGSPTVLAGNKDPIPGCKFRKHTRERCNYSDLHWWWTEMV